MRNKKNNNLVSIIIISYNNLQYLTETIDSVLKQDYSDIELIIGDDGTKKFDLQGYEEYVNKFKKGNIKSFKIYTNHINIGIVKNLNKALKMCNGEYIKIIAGDDVFFNEFVISKMISYMEEKKINILLTNTLYCDINMNELEDINSEQSKSKYILKDGENPPEFFKWLALTNRIPAPGVMFKKYIFEEYGEFDERYRLLDDWPMWLKLSRNGCKIYYLDIVSVKYRYNIGVSTNSNIYFLQDLEKCIEEDILPYKKQLGNKIHKRIKYRFIKKYKLNQYNYLEKIIFYICNLNMIIREYIKRT